MSSTVVYSGQPQSVDVDTTPVAVEVSPGTVVLGAFNMIENTSSSATITSLSIARSLDGAHYGPERVSTKTPLAPGAVVDLDITDEPMLRWRITLAADGPGTVLIVSRGVQ